ncbi:MAG: hypothetical protein COW65_03245 [Cytophagales bacterium CG18_big_fil_WC_8_21_14_2_50_42_9]|nr:MAG: hypothetical protein COW65_03245 [Cytophagales bacterium CG18_big_fil_WC_8_21_14_2_50_42_9]
MKDSAENIAEENNDFAKKGGVSGQQPGPHEGPVASGADNTRGENVPSREGNGGGAKHGKSRPDSDYPQGTHANPATTTRGADSADKEFRNNQQQAG